MQSETPLKRMNSVNTTRVLRTIYLNPGISRIEIAHRLNLNKSTVTTIVRKLESIGLIQALSLGKSSATGGRRPIQLQIHATWGCVLGIEIHTESYTVVVTNLLGDVIFDESGELDVRKQGLIKTFSDLILTYKEKIETRNLRLVGIGLGLPGFVDPVTGTLEASIPLEIFSPVPLTQQANALFPFDIPIVVDNDANCGCYGEITADDSDKIEDFAFVLGEFRKHTVALEDVRILALGLGLVIDGKVHHGKDFSAGEFRSIYFEPEHLNQLAISDDEGRKFMHDPDINTKVVEELSRHIAFLVHILNLKKVVLGGPIEILESQFSENLNRRLDESWQYPNKYTCLIQSSKKGSLSVAYGAAKMFLQHLITIPDLNRDERGPMYGADLLKELTLLP